MLSNIYSFSRMVVDHSYSQIVEIFNGNYENNVTERINPEPNSYIDTFINLWSEPNWIIDNIYLGNAYNASSYSTLENLNIKSIVNVTKEVNNYFEYTNYFNYIKIPISDKNTSSLSKYFDKVLEFIYENQKNEGNILIHCFAGRSRSVTIVALYLMKKYNMSLDNAIKYIKEKRNIININTKFYEELKKI